MTGFQVPKTECPKCYGSGSVPMQLVATVECTLCDGEGRVNVTDAAQWRSLHRPRFALQEPL